MKKIYIIIALLGSFLGAKAQNTIDIQAVAFANDGENFQLGKILGADTAYNNTDSIYGAVLLYLNDGIVLNGDKITLLSSFNHYLQPDDPQYVDTIKYFYASTYTMVQDVTGPDGLIGITNRPVDSIGLLMDWNYWSTNDSVVLNGIPWIPFVNGKEYGFFIQNRGDAGVTDSDPTNDRDVVRIIWNGAATGLNDMIASKEKIGLNVYPNPANNVIKIDQNFEKRTNVHIIVRDAVGRTMLTQNMEKVIGNQNIQVDVTKLTSGMYTVELTTDYATGLSKFTKL